MEDHPINIIISIYCKYFSNYLRNQLDELIDFKNTNNNLFYNKINLFSDTIVEDLQRFIIKIQTTTKLFYCKSVNLDFFVNLIDLCIFSFIFDMFKVRFILTFTFK